MTVFGPDLDRQLEQSIRRDGQALTLPPMLYTSGEVFDFERRHILCREWIPLGPATDIREPGEYFTRQVLGEPLIAVRDHDGEVKVLSAVCRHRGAHVVQGTGCARVLVCPYHTWTYRLDGTLIGTPDRNPGVVETATHSLKRFRSEVWGGFVMVNFDDGARPMAECYPNSTAAIENYRLNEPAVMHGAGPATLRPWNWKISLENILDVPHIPFLHHRFAGFMAEEGQADSGGAGVVHLEPGPGDLDLVSRVPASSDDYVTNVTGKHLLPPHEHLNPQERGQGVNVAAGPSLNLFLSPDTALYVTYLPVSANSTEVTYGGFWDGRARDLPHARYIIDQLLLDTALIVASEDIAVDAMVQISMESTQAPRGPLGEGEYNLLLFNEWLVGRYRACWPKSEPV